MKGAMITGALITNNIPPLKPGDTASRALGWMDEFKVRHLPVVKGGEYLGLVSESELLDLNLPDETLSKQIRTFQRLFIARGRHPFEALQRMASNRLTVLPVLDDEEQNYLGNITLLRVVQEFGRISSVSSPGGVIVLEVNVRDYSLAEIGQIVESCGAKALSAYVTSHPDSTRLEVTVKVNVENLNELVQAFTRYNYQVTAHYRREEQTGALKERMEYFWNYLKM